jgi:hypothetical protein
VHPVVIPFLLLLITTLLASIVGTVIGLWRNVRRPQHRAAFVWGLACFLPLGCWIGLSCDTLRVMANGQSLPKNVFSDISNMASATLMEGDLRLAYRQQLESQRLVMFYDDRVISPHSDLEAMDRHLADLELATGRSLRPKVHWVRGGLACGKWPFAVSAWEVRTALPIGNLPIIQIG